MGNLENKINRLSEKWGFANIEHIPSARMTPVYRVHMNSGGIAVLKILEGEHIKDEIEGGKILDYYSGRGAIKILRSEEGSFLLEFASGKELADISLAGEDEKATDIICDVVKELHENRDTLPPSTLKPLEERLSQLFGGAKTSKDKLVLEAAAIARELIDTTKNPIPLHGDLHHRNILESERGWLAIDPLGLIGDPCYEVANSYGNPLDAETLTENPERTKMLTEKFSDKLGYSYERIAKFAFVHHVTASLWGGYDFRYRPNRLKIARNLRLQFK